jgi:predicted nucleic acid-binding protein
MAGPARPRRHQPVREAAAPGYATLAPGGLTGVPTYCTAIQRAEIHAGIRAGEEPLTQAFFDARGEVVIDGRVGRLAGAYLARYARSHAVELGDALVAAAAATAGLRLWTRNRKRYPMTDLRFYEA